MLILVWLAWNRQYQRAVQALKENRVGDAHQHNLSSMQFIPLMAPAGAADAMLLAGLLYWLLMAAG